MIPHNENSRLIDYARYKAFFEVYDEKQDRFIPSRSGTAYKKILILCMTALFLMGFCGACTSSAGQLSESELIALNDAETYPDGPFSLAKEFSSLDEIQDCSDLIVECCVDNVETVMVQGFPQTHSVVTVNAVFKGDVETGQTLKVLEESFGIPQTEEGQHFILFLVDSKLPGYEEAYYITGAFQGKFIEKEGYYFQQATEGVKLSLDVYYPQTIDGFSDILASANQRSKNSASHFKVKEGFLWANVPPKR